MITKPGELTPAVLSRLIGRPVRRLELRTLSSIGCTSDLFVVMCDDGDFTLVAKFLCPEKSPLPPEYHQREVHFYREIASKCDLRVPKMLFGDVGEDGRGLLVMEDLTGSTDVGNPFEGAEVHQIAGLVKELGRLHGATWGQTDLSWLARRQPQPDGARRFSEASDRFLTRLDPDRRLAFKAPVEALQAGFDRLVELRQDSPVALIHNDLNLDNVLFPRDGGRPVIFDWQLCALGRVGLDLAHSVGMGLRPGDRAAHELRLLELYRTSLSHSGGVALSAERLERIYELGLLTRLLGMIWHFAVTEDWSTKWFAHRVERSWILHAVLERQALRHIAA